MSETTATQGVGAMEPLASAVADTVRDQQSSSAARVQEGRDGARFLDWLGQSVTQTVTNQLGTTTRLGLQDPNAASGDKAAQRHAEWKALDEQAAFNRAQALRPSKTTQDTEPEPSPAAEVSKSEPTDHRPDTQKADDIRLLQKVLEAPQHSLQVAAPLPVTLQQAVTQQLADSLKGAASSASNAMAHGLALTERMEAWLKQAALTGRPIRVALDDQSALVLRIRQGKVSAEFLMQDAQRLAAVQAQLLQLRQKLQQQDLPVEDVVARAGLWHPEQGGQQSRRRQDEEQQSSAQQQ